MTAAGPRGLLPNLVTLKLEGCEMDMQFVRYLRARSPLRNLSVRESFFGRLAPHRFPPAPQRMNTAVLTVLDISGTGQYTCKLAKDWVLNDEECQVTHLFMENCFVIPRRVMPPHLKIEFLSVAGIRASWMETVNGRGSAFLDIEAWATIPSIREINASGCILSQVERDILVTTRPNIVFDLREGLHESQRPYL